MFAPACAIRSLMLLKGMSAGTCLFLHDHSLIFLVDEPHINASNRGLFTLMVAWTLTQRGKKIPTAGATRPETIGADTFSNPPSIKMAHPSLTRHGEL